MKRSVSALYQAAWAGPAPMAAARNAKIARRGAMVTLAHLRERREPNASRAVQLQGPVQASIGFSRNTGVRGGTPSSAQLNVSSALPIAKDLHVSTRLRPKARVTASPLRSR